MLSLAACAVLQPATKAPGLHAELQAGRISDTTRQLNELETVDMLLSVNNDIMAPHLREGLVAGLALIPGWSGDRVQITFLPGYVALDIQGSYELTTDQATAVSLSGELVPYFQPDGLAWQASLHDLAVQGPVTPAGNNDQQSVPEAQTKDQAVLLDLLEQQLRAAMSQNGSDLFAMNVMPLGILETGIRLRSPFQLVQTQSSPLAGVLTVSSAAVLVNANDTRMALDLGFVATLPECTDVAGIGRATFARNISSREPVEPATGRAPQDQARVFFTDVLNVKTPTTVIHYWFADGQPVSITELNVEPSARWRTWSAVPNELETVSHLQVLVLEKRSGCVLANRSLQIEPAVNPAITPETETDPFNDLAKEFGLRTADHVQPGDAADAAVVSMKRGFFALALAEAMHDLRVASSPKVEDSNLLPINARLGAVPAETLSCDRQDCGSERVCTLNFDSCPVQRDTRDCSSCLLRNPLNNRCIREAEDPICLAARDNENDRLEGNRQACIGRQTRLRDNCLLVRELEQENCKAQASLEVSACAARIEEMRSLFDGQGPIAEMRGQAMLTGTMRFEFSEFRLDKDLQRISMMLSLDTDLSATGQVNFQPASGLTALGQCLQATSDEYRTSIALPAWEGGLVANVELDDLGLLAEWSGLIQRLEAKPSPVTQFFTSHRDAIRNCDIGLNATQALNQLSGQGSELLLGILDLDMQPEPTRLTLLPAYLTTGEKTLTGDARVDGQFVSYRLLND